jgi:hypothetical protein
MKIVVHSGKKYSAYAKSVGGNMSDIKTEMNQVIGELQKQGISPTEHLTNQEDLEGLGDLVEAALKKFGITEEKFKNWFNLQECGCAGRKKWLNGLFSWKKNK